MTAAQRERLKQMIEAALDLDGAARTEFLQTECEGDPELRAALDELLEGRGPLPEILRDDAWATGLVPVFQPGQLVGGRFRIVRFHGRGGMGEVFEAFDERLNVRLGLKTLRPDLMSDTEAMDRFRREIRVARQVTHPNLCRVYDLVEQEPLEGDSQELACLTMEWIEGETLQALIERSRPLSTGIALPLIRQVAAALDALHGAGIVHRDLKPGNIMLAPQPDGGTRAVVTDFGLAKPAVAGREWFESQRDAQAGAPYFMAPEQLRNERPTPASDIYGFGLLIDEMVTQSRAFSAGSLAALYYQRLWEEPLAPSARSPGLPEIWDHTIRSCLAADPLERPSTAGEVLRALDEGPRLHRRPAAAVPRPSRAWMGRSLWALVPIAMGLAIAGGALSHVDTSVKVFDIDGEGSTPDLSYVARGTTAEILRRLTHLGGVRVIPARTTRRAAEPERAETQFSLDGSLLAASGTTRLTINLSDNKDGSLVWSDVFEGRLLGDPVLLQSRIADGAVTALERQVLAKELGRSGLSAVLAPMRAFLGRDLRSQMPRTPTADPEALELYMRGSKLYEEISPASVHAALGYFERALERDPRFALAMSAAADSCIYLKNQNAANAEFYLEKARQMAEAAVRADPSLAEGHAALAAVKQAGWDWAGAEKSYQEAFRLKPAFARAHRWYCGLIIQFGRFDEALEHGRKAMELDPHDRANPGTVGLYLFLARRYKEAVVLMEPAVGDLESPGTRYNLSQVYSQLAAVSSGAEAREYFRKAIEQARIIDGIETKARMLPGAADLPPLADHVYALAYSLAGDAAAAEPYFSRMREAWRLRRIPAITVAWVYAAQNRTEEAISVLEQAVAYRDPALLYIKVLPFFDKLQGEPRFQALLSQLRL